MRKGRVISFKSCNKIIDFIFKNRFLVVVSVFFVVGFILSVVFSGKYDTVNDWGITLIESFIKNRTDSTFLKIAINSFFGSMFFIVICFASGTSVLGMIFVPLCVAARGFIYGTVASVLYSEHLLKGIAFHTVLILPSAIIFMLSFLFAANESINFSLMITRLTLPQTMPMNLSLSFKNYCVKYLIACIIVVFSASVDALLCGSFLKVFSL